MEKVIAIVGPTAVGKTKLSIELAKQLNGEVISGDAMQVYRGMDIGTAKITPLEMEGVPHHLLDEKSPDERYSVAEFQKVRRKSELGVHVGTVAYTRPGSAVESQTPKYQNLIGRSMCHHPVAFFRRLRLTALSFKQGNIRRVEKC